MPPNYPLSACKQNVCILFSYDYVVCLKLLFKDTSMDANLFVFPDCKSIFDTITVLKIIRELRLMNEIAYN